MTYFTLPEKLGNGNAYAISKLLAKINSSMNYKPEARIKLSSIINNYATACMDTSDGLLSTLDQLMRLNNVGFELTEKLENIIDDDVLNYSKKLNIPSWLLFAGQHGEFELIFTIPQGSQKEFLEDAKKIGFEPIELGKVIPSIEITINLYDKLIPINTALIRNLPYQSNGDINHYLKLLLGYDSELKNSTKLDFTSH